MFNEVAVHWSGAILVVDIIVIVDVSLASGAVEPDVRLKMTLPTGKGNGCTLPLVLLVHSPDVESPGLPQQNDVPFGHGKSSAPLAVSTMEKTVTVSQS